MLEECHYTSRASESEGAHLSVSGAQSVQASCIPLQLLNRKGVLTEIPYFQCIFSPPDISFASEEDGNTAVFVKHRSTRDWFSLTRSRCITWVVNLWTRWTWRVMFHLLRLFKQISIWPCPCDASHKHLSNTGWVWAGDISTPHALHCSVTHSALYYYFFVYLY